MCLGAWNALLVSLQGKVKNLALNALLALTKMSPGKEPVRLALLELGLWKKALNQKLTASQSVDMELTVPVAWCLAWNAPKTVTQANLPSTGSRNASLALKTCLLSNLVPMLSPCAGRSVLLAITLKLACLLVHLAQSTFSNP